MNINLPQYFKIEQKIENNYIYQLGFDSVKVNAVIEEYDYKRVKGYILNIDDDKKILISPNKKWSAHNKFDEVILAKNFKDIHTGKFNNSNYKWIKSSNIRESNTCQEVLESYKNTFSFKKEDIANEIEGLRSPQLGGIYASLAHWQIGNEPATIVMPTGTGKTETMLSLFVVSDCKKILIIVPSDALREQLAKKFINLGLLKDLNIVDESALYPTVCIMKHRPLTINEIDELFDNSNVIITTISVVGQLEKKLQQAMSSKCTHLFVDEAHHIAAETWKKFVLNFTDKYILQFTATPFRNDDKNIGGKIIFNYPLGKAQEEGYFKKIINHFVYEYNPMEYDRAIAEKAIEILREDLKKGYNHILMARVSSIQRANDVYKIYSEYKEFNPIVIHTGLGSEKQKKNRQDILNYKTRVIICVDMFGEGFDMPELKIAAFHDIKKSLPITLQLAGRFTRTNRDNNLGEASIVINLANIEVKNKLKALYSQDSDWNKILPIISDDNTREQESLYEFMQGFNKFPDEIQLQNITPALSTVVYRTDIETWNPGNFEKGIKGIVNFDQVFWDVNSEKRTLVIVTGNKSSIKWGNIKDIYELDWTLYIVYWNKEQQLLYINCSANGSMFEKLAEGVSLGTASPINAKDVFRSLGNVNRLRINNVGLKELSKLRSFTMCAGEDVEPALSSVQLVNRVKSNIFGVGYENGEKVSVGCSYRGRIWTQKTGNIKEFISWCNSIGKKLLDENIDSDKIFSGAIYPKTIKERPALMPISIEWNESIYDKNEDNIYIENNEALYPFDSFELSLFESSEKGDIQFKISNSAFYSIYKIEITDKNFKIINIKNPINIKIGGWNDSIANYLYKAPPTIRFFNGTWLEGNQYIEFEFKGSSYKRDKIKVWNWDDVNIREESQGEQKISGNIQKKVITKLLNDDYDIIFDDDGSGEAADIVTVKVNDYLKEIKVEFFHLKYSHDEKPGARINDLYEVCGQAQKSIFWKGRGGYDLFKHMIKRESKRVSNNKNTRFEKGTIKDIELIKEKSNSSYKTDFKIYIVQPGLSVEKASEQQLELLAVTENHLLETYMINLDVIGSK